ncbi:unnamed protein product [Eretmochelys imbricata]
MNCVLEGKGPSERKMLLLTRVVWLSVLCAVALGCPTIVSRSQWEAQVPRSRDPLGTPVPYAIIHHTAGNHCTSQVSCSRQVRGIQSYHMDKKGWSDIGYNFLIGEDESLQGQRLEHHRGPCQELEQ